MNEDILGFFFGPADKSLKSKNSGPSPLEQLCHRLYILEGSTALLFNKWSGKSKPSPSGGPKDKQKQNPLKRWYQGS